MSNEYHIHSNRPLPSDGDTEKRKNFAALLHEFDAKKSGSIPEKPAAKASNFWAFWGVSSAALVLIVGFIWWNNQAATPAPYKNVENTLPPTQDSLKPVREIDSIHRANTATSKQQTSAAKVQTPAQTKESAPPSAPSATTAPPINRHYTLPQKPKNRLVGIKADLSQFPELKEYTDLSWEYAGTSEETDPWKHAIFGKENVWDDIQLRKLDAETYEISLKKKDKSFRIPVKPVFVGKAYENALKTYEAQSNSSKIR